MEQQLYINKEREIKGSSHRERERELGRVKELRVSKRCPPPCSFYVYNEIRHRFPNPGVPRRTASPSLAMRPAARIVPHHYGTPMKEKGAAFNVTQIAG